MANKKDLVNSVHELLDEKGLNITKKDTGVVLDAVLDSIIGLTGEAEKLQLIGFGNFEVRERAARKGRNPQNGNEIDIPATKAVGFKAGKVFKDFIK